jgi:plastocyanin
MRPRAAAWALVLLAAGAGEPTGTVAGTVVVRRQGQPLDASGVVAYVVGFDEAPPARAVEIRQHDKQFLPSLVAITAGQSVSFPNDDPFYHNVFSPSAAHKFDLGQYPKGETQTKRFPGIGVVDVFCNIHPQMAATVLVLPNRRFARAAPDGGFRIEGVPPGHWMLYAWRRGVTEPASAPIDVTAGGVAQVELALEVQRDDTAHLNKFGEPYREGDRYH